MDLFTLLSEQQVDLMRRLIEFAENNDFFESEFDGGEDRQEYAELRRVAQALDRQLSESGSTTEDSVSLDLAPARLPSITVQDGHAWWDLSTVELGLNPDEFNQRLRAVRQFLRALLFCSASFNVRQAILEALYALQSVDPGFANEESTPAS